MVALATDVATAVAEKLSAMQTAEFFASRKARADYKAFDKIMKRRGGEPPRAGDEMPGGAHNSKKSKAKTKPSNLRDSRVGARCIVPLPVEFCPVAAEGEWRQWRKWRMP